MPKKPPIDVSTLEICSDAPPEKRINKFKYDDVFLDMKPGQAIKCKTEDVGPIAAALRDFVERHNLKNSVRQSSYYSETEPRGRVWLL